MQRGFAVALGHSDHFQEEEELEMAQHWQRRAGILSRGMPETESRSFVLLVTVVMLPTSCSSGFSQESWDVVTLVTNRAATLQTLCISQGGVGAIEELFSATPEKHQPPFASALVFFVLLARVALLQAQAGVTFACSGPHPGGSEAAIGKCSSHPQPATIPAGIKIRVGPAECVVLAETASSGSIGGEAELGTCWL